MDVYVKSTYPELKELYESDPQWTLDFPTFELFVDWMRNIKDLIEKTEYLLAKSDKK